MTAPEGADAGRMLPDGTLVEGELPDAAMLAAAMTQRLTGNLELTPEQVPQVETVLRMASDQALALAEQTRSQPDNANRAALAQQVRSIFKDAQSELEEVLTPAQSAQLARQLAAERQAMLAESWFSTYRQPLELTAKQEDVLRPIVGAHLESMMEAMPRGGGSGRSGMREMLAARDRIQSREAAFEKQLKVVLDKKQMKAYRRQRTETRTQVRDDLMMRGRRRLRR